MSNQLSQLALEILRDLDTSAVTFRVSQVAIEVLRSSTPETVTARAETFIWMPV